VAPPLLYTKEPEYVEFRLPQAPPSIDQLYELTSLPAGLASAMNSRVRRTSRRKQERLAREGQIISKAFDAFGARPAPSNGLSLEQTVVLEMSSSARMFLVSSATSGLPTFGGLSVTMAQFSGATGLLSVFDQYRIEQVEAWIEQPSPNTNAIYPVLHSAVDLDDANVPTSVGQIDDHQGALITSGPAGHYHKWKPHIAVASFSGAFTSYSNMPSQWIDAASPNVQHYGLKYATVSNGNTLGYDLVLRIVASFRAPAIN